MVFWPASPAAATGSLEGESRGGDSPGQPLEEVRGSAMADSKSHVLYNEPALPDGWAVMEGATAMFSGGT